MSSALVKRVEVVSPSDAAPKGHPLLIQRGAEAWGAVRRWTREYLREAAGDSEIPVWLLTGEPVPSQRGMTRFDDYIDWAFADAAEQEVVKYYAGRVNFNLLPETLRSDIEQPPFLPDPPAEANLWMGRPTTRSGLHWDPTIGLLAQVRGRKRVKLIPPDEWPRLHGYPHRHGPNSRARMQDADEAFPLPFDLETWEAELHPGDMLYIPPGWWHDLESLDAATISVNFWWQTSLLRQLRISNIRRMVLIDAIHAARSSVRRLGPRGSPKSGQSGSHETRPVKERDPGR